MNEKGITAYGRYWEFGRAEEKNSRLLGIRQGSDIPIDMAFQIGIYILYDRRKAVYVGKTERGGLIKRLKEHRKGKKWGRWDRFSWFGIVPVDEKTGKLQEQKGGPKSGPITDVGESLLIEVLEPYLNMQSGNCMGEMYVQVRQHVETVQGTSASS